MKPAPESPYRPAWLLGLARWIKPEPATHKQVLQVMRNARQRGLLDQSAMDTIERVFRVADMRVRDILIPRSQMIVVERDDKPKTILHVVVESGHSRFPVIDESRDRIIGVMMAKDLLRYFQQDNNEAFDIKDLTRPASFVPESKRLNVLLEEFQAQRNHMAIVVNEYGGVAGLITIEDVLEQIVGDISDEHDAEESEQLIVQRDTHDFIVKALCSLEDFNQQFHFPDPVHDIETVGGLVLSQFGRLPERGECVEIAGWTFEVLNADSRRILLLHVYKP